MSSVTAGQALTVYSLQFTDLLPSTVYRLPSTDSIGETA